MKKQWSYSLDNGSNWTVFEPVNGAKLHIREKEAEIEKGQIFKRKELTAAVSIGKPAYTILKNIEMRGSQRCSEILMRLEIKCGYAWNELWVGKFSPGSGEWELDNCLLNVKPETVDRYTCLLEKEKVKRNILQVGTVPVRASAAPSIEWASCLAVPDTLTTFASDCSDGIVLNAAGDTPANWWEAYRWQPGLITAFGSPFDVHVIYWREFLLTECVGGSPVSPPGVGWVLLEDNCAVDGTAKYIREPLITYTFGDAVGGTCDGDVAIPPVSPCDGQWVLVSQCGLTLPDAPNPDVTYPPYFVCYTPDMVDLDRGRTLQGATEYIIDQSGCDEVLGIRSDFFEWNAVGSAPGYAPGINYITGAVSQVNALCILQKSDVINPTATNPASIGEMTFAELMTMLYVEFRVLWDIDDAGYVRIEHWHYWTFVQGLDLTTTAQTVEIPTYKHLNEQIPRIERLIHMESQGRDFVGKDILYSGPCAKSDDVKEWSPGKITTDVTFILNDPTAISRDGFVLLATAYNGTAYDTIIDAGAITGNLISNAPLSAGNLERDYWTWDRYLPDGNMNGHDTVFDGFLPNIEQANVRLTMCCELLVFKSSRTVKSRLSVRLGVSNATIQDVDYDLPADRVTMTLRYAY